MSDTHLQAQSPEAHCCSATTRPLLCHPCTDTMTDPSAEVSAPMDQPRASPHKRHCPPLDLLTDDTWLDIIGRLGFRDKLRVQQTCRRFCNLLANPTSTSTWGKIELRAPSVKTSSDVWQLCDWVLQRLEGISALCYTLRGEQWDTQQMQRMMKVWHALVAATADTGIRLKLCTACLPPSYDVLLPLPMWQLRQRLTALTLEVSCAHDIKEVFSLAALRHLKMECPVDVDVRLLDWPGPVDYQLSRLRTLQLTRVPPAAFFLPGTAACLQQLHSVALHQCRLPDSVLPSEMLRLQALSRLDLLQLPLPVMPDLRRLPALRWLIMSGNHEEPDLDASQAECSAELKAALEANPLGGATGLTAAVLHAIPISFEDCADAIERLPNLEVLGVDFLASESGAYYAATLQRRMRRRCFPASRFVVMHNDKARSGHPWPDKDW